MGSTLGTAGRWSDLGRLSLQELSPGGYTLIRILPVLTLYYNHQTIYFVTHVLLIFIEKYLFDAWCQKAIEGHPLISLSQSCYCRFSQILLFGALEEIGKIELTKGFF